MNKTYIFDIPYEHNEAIVNSFKIIHRGYKVPYIYFYDGTWQQWRRISKYYVYMPIIGQALKQALEMCEKQDGRKMKLEY